MFVDALRQSKPVNASSLPSTISHGFNSSSSSILSQVKQVLVIQQHVRDIIHHPLLLPQHKHQRQHQQDDNDMLIASAAALKQLIRLASTSLHSHSALALLALVAILDELLERAPFALQRHALVRAKLGRVIVLEMAALLKTFSLPHRQKLTYQYKNGEKHELHRWTDHLVACLKPPTLLYEKHWILAWLTRVCRAAAQYDTHWQFKQEYDQVILLANEHL
ncbi:hypothetical protein BC940DRAFT_323068 [Gongronella butleri]|nr:hypothetical protein BC940DRAFT_323068 [Gongronella butleri]